MLGLMVRPYFSPKPCVAATTTEAQSVNGMKPTVSAAFSGASEPAAQAALRSEAGADRPSAAIPLTAPARAMDCLRKLRRLVSSGLFESRSVMGLILVRRINKNGVRQAASNEREVT